MLQQPRASGDGAAAAAAARARGAPKQEALCVLIDDQGGVAFALLAWNCGPPPRRRDSEAQSKVPAFAAGLISLTTMRKQRLVSELQLRHRDIRALEPGVALPCEIGRRSGVLHVLGLQPPGVLGVNC